MRRFIPPPTKIEPIIPHLTTSEFNKRVHWQFRQKQLNHNTRLTLAAAFRTNQIYMNICYIYIVIMLTVVVLLSMTYIIIYYYGLSSVPWRSTTSRLI